MNLSMGNSVPTGRVAVWLAAVWFGFALTASAARPMALVIMLDGCRADAVENATAPNLQKLMAGQWQPGYRCASSLTAHTIPDGPTHSAPNHAAIATGVTSAKTNVRSNREFGNCYNEERCSSRACEHAVGDAACCHAVSYNECHQKSHEHP